MKRLGKASLPATLLALTGCISAASSWMKDSAPTPPPGAGEAKVIFYRPPNYWRHNEVWQLWDEDRMIALAENGGCVEYRCAPGKHLFFLLPGSEPAVDAELVGGRTYYVQVEMKMALVAYPVLNSKRKGTEAERRERDDEVGRCGHRELLPERATEEKLAARKQMARERIEVYRGPKAGECRLLRPEDGE